MDRVYRFCAGTNATAADSGAPISIRLGQGRGQVAEGVEVLTSGVAGNMLVFGALGGLEMPGDPRLLTLRNEANERTLRISPATGWITLVDPE